MAIKRVLYLGLRCPCDTPAEQFVHYPVIGIRPRIAVDFSAAANCTHALFTSPTAVELVAGRCHHLVCLAVGPSTAAALRAGGAREVMMANEYTAEGLCAMLPALPKSSRIFYPHSELARPLIRETLEQLGLGHYDVPLYDTIHQVPGPPPELSEFDVIDFTSPSTVSGFLAIYGSFPIDCELRGIGPITERALAQSGHRR